jgi:hypothetical protein
MKLAIIALVCFATLAEGRILTCQFLDFTLPIVDQVYLCRGQISALNTTVIERVDGTHLTNRNNLNVTAIAITEQAVVQIPSNLAGIFPNLRSVDFSNAQVVTISAANLVNLKNLVFLRLLNNQVKSIEGNLFSSNRQLQYIDFRGNSLETVGVNLLGNLSSLIDVNFLRNKCIDARASNAKEIAELNQQLPIRCPPQSVTTTSPVTTTSAPGSSTTLSSAPTVPTVTTTTELEICHVPCDDLTDMANQIAYLENRLKEVGAWP